jgi:hypothetical protein
MGIESRRRSLEAPYSAWRSEVDRFLELAGNSASAPQPADLAGIRQAIRDMDLAMRDYMWSVRRVRAGDLVHGSRGDDAGNFRATQ